MRFGSVCSGIEAASVAWQPLGWEAAWFSEIEPFPSAVLAHHYPTVPNLGDMTRLPDAVRRGDVEAPDLLCGGTPCQAFSVAGLRRSLDDTRGNLTLTFVELADAIDDVRRSRGEQPAIVFWENVPGVLTTKDNAFGCFLGALAGESEPLVAPGGRWSNAGCVFGPQRAIAWRVVDAQYFGLAQRRKRVFVVSSARDDFDPAAVLFESDGLRRDFAPSRMPGERTPATFVPSVAGCLETTSHDYSRADGFTMIACATGDRSHALTTQSNASKDGTGRGVPIVPVAHAFDARQSDVLQYGDRTGPLDTDGHSIGVLAFDTTQITSPANRSQPKPGDPCHPLAAGAHAPAIAMSELFTLKVRGRAGGRTLESRQDGLANALRTPSGGRDGMGVGAVATAMQVRRLTPRECERLQGFPDDYTAIQWRGKSAADCPDGPRYRALGNSWAVPVVRWIGQRITAALEAEP